MMRLLLRQPKFATLTALVFFVCTSVPVVQASPAERGAVVYTNSQYGFRLFLPRHWTGYSVEVQILNAYVGGQSRFRFHEMLIRDPRWTRQSPRQDIPIMIFTRAQWKLVNSGSVMVTTAPVGPIEIGHNRRYVFALPPRYVDIDLPGNEDVQKLFRNHPFEAF